MNKAFITSTTSVLLKCHRNVRKQLKNTHKGNAHYTSSMRNDMTMLKN